MTAKNSKTYLGYLNKSVDEQKKVIIVLLVTSLFMLIFFLCLKKFRQILKPLNSEVLRMEIF